MKVRFWLGVLSAGLCSMVNANSNVDTVLIPQPKPQLERFEVGVLAIRGSLSAQTRWQPTMEWLAAQVPNTQFILKPLTLPEMAKAVKEKTVDFVVTNPGQAVRLGRQFKLSWLATMTSQSSVNRTNHIGSALVVNRLSPYISFEQLQGKPISAVAESAFGGYLTLRYEVVKAGLNPNAFFSNVQFLGFPIDANLYQLRDGNAEAAVVPACLLENMISEGLLEADQFRVINNIAPVGFACNVSTPLYANWSFAKTERVSSQLGKTVAQALLSMPAESLAATSAKASGWTSPVSLLEIDQLYRELDIHPLQQPWWKEALIWLKYNQQWAWAFFIFVVVLNVYHFWVEFKFSRSKKQLVETQNRLKAKSEQLEHSQRVAVVGELGSSLAHEINQPLAAIRNYSEGGLLRLAKNKPADEIAPVFEKIQSQVERADAIIQRLRGMIQKRSAQKAPTDLELLIGETTELLEYRLSQQGIQLTSSIDGSPSLLEIDAIGIQQVLVNVINNAIDACITFKESTLVDNWQAMIDIKVTFEGESATICITDNGIGLADQELSYEQAFVSTKQDGLGLGLAICRDVIEAHNGRFELASALPSGCRAVIMLPCCI